MDGNNSLFCLFAALLSIFEILFGIDRNFLDPAGKIGRR